MPRRRVWFATLMLALVVVAASGLLIAVVRARPAPPGSRITLDAVSSIQAGMTYAEVESLLGCPPGDYDPAHSSFIQVHVTRPPGVNHQWNGRETRVLVQFDGPGSDGKVVTKSFADFSARNAADGLRARLLRFLRL